nr:hypothetical protein [Pseudomonas sp. BIGb0427]
MQKRFDHSLMVGCPENLDACGARAGAPFAEAGEQIDCCGHGDVSLTESEDRVVCFPFDHTKEGAMNVDQRRLIEKHWVVLELYLLRPGCS